MKEPIEFFIDNYKLILFIVFIAAIGLCALPYWIKNQIRLGLGMRFREVYIIEPNENLTSALSVQKTIEDSGILKENNEEMSLSRTHPQARPASQQTARRYGGKNAQTPPLCWSSKFLLGEAVHSHESLSLLRISAYFGQNVRFSQHFQTYRKKKIYRKFKKGLTTALKCVTIVTRKSPPVFLSRKPLDFH